LSRGFALASIFCASLLGYCYDALNRLVTASNGSSVSAAYAYDPLGRRIQKSGTGVTQTFFLNDGSDEIAEYSSSGAVVRRFVPGPAINEPIVYENCSGATQPACTGNVAYEYFHTDHHGSVIAMSGTGAQSVEGPYTYDGYGNGAALTGVPFKFVGMYLDAETGLYFDRARYYSPSLGRFLQTDPLGYKDDLDLYTYVGNDPTDKTDPTGMDICSAGTGSNIPTTTTSSGGVTPGDPSAACGATPSVDGNKKQNDAGAASAGTVSTGSTSPRGVQVAQIQDVSSCHHDLECLERAARAESINIDVVKREAEIKAEKNDEVADDSIELLDLVTPEKVLSPLRKAAAKTIAQSAIKARHAAEVRSIEARLLEERLDGISTRALEQNGIYDKVDGIDIPDEDGPR
jgi:RHS repeat-associated protein